MYDLPFGRISLEGVWAVGHGRGAVRTEWRSKSHDPHPSDIHTPPRPQVGPAPGAEELHVLSQTGIQSK